MPFWETHDVFVRAIIRPVLVVLLRSRIDRILGSIGPEANGCHERPHQVVGTVDTGLCRKAPTVEFLYLAVELELSHDPFKGDLGDSLGKIRVEFARVEILARYEADFCKSRDSGPIRFCRRIGFHQLSKQGEVSLRIHLIHLIAHRDLGIDGWIDLAFWWRISFSVGAERRQFALVLQFVDCLVVLEGAGAVNAAKNPNDIGWRLVFSDSLWKHTIPARAGYRVSLRSGPSGALSGNLKHRRPPVEHRE